MPQNLVHVPAFRGGNVVQHRLPDFPEDSPEGVRSSGDHPGVWFLILITSVTWEAAR